MKDKRYTAAKLLIQANQVTDLKQIFDFLPISVVAEDARMNYSTLYRKVNNVRTLTVGDMEKMAALLEVEVSQIFTVIALTLKNTPKKPGKAALKK